MTRQAVSEDSDRLRSRERLVLLILAAVQFTTIVDFMIVMPLGPQLMRTLEIRPGAVRPDRLVLHFRRRRRGAGRLVDRRSLRASHDVHGALRRVPAGHAVLRACAQLPAAHRGPRRSPAHFGGILGGMAMAIIGDVFPEHRRGRATGSLMTGFSLASVAGVPLGLFLGTNYGWHVPFVVLAIGGLPALLLTPLALPPLDAHVGKLHAHPLRSLVDTFSHANHLNAFALIVALMIGSFTVFPYLSPYLVAQRRA